MKLYIILPVLMAIVTSNSIVAKEQPKKLFGEYVPVSGFAKSIEVSRPHLGESPEQIGEFKLVLVNKDWQTFSDELKKKVKKKLVIRGIYKGKLDPTNGTLTHTLTTKNRDGVIYSEFDFMLPEQGDAYCSSGSPLKGVEQMNFVMGSGKFKQLSSGTLFLNGLVNNCPGSEQFLLNEFDVIPNLGGLTFSE